MREELGQAVGVEPNWLHPLIIRKHWSLADFHQLNRGVGENKAPWDRRTDSTVHPSWDKGSNGWLSVREKGRGESDKNGTHFWEILKMATFSNWRLLVMEEL